MTKTELVELAIVAAVIVGVYEVVARASAAHANPAATNTSGATTGNAAATNPYSGLINQGGGQLLGWLGDAWSNIGQTNSGSGVSAQGDTYNSAGGFIGNGLGDDLGATDGDGNVSGNFW